MFINVLITVKRSVGVIEKICVKFFLDKALILRISLTVMIVIILSEQKTKTLTKYVAACCMYIT